LIGISNIDPGAAIEMNCSMPGHRQSRIDAAEPFRALEPFHPALL
jgi:hypothetical protein